jgi:chloride channel protein, CIC family
LEQLPEPASPPANTPAVALQAARREEREFLQLQEQRRTVFPRAVLVGLLAGLLAVTFRWALQGGEGLRTQLIRWAHAYPTWGWLLPVGIGAVGAGIAVRLVVRVAPETAGSGIPHLKAVLYRLRPMRWPRVLVVKFVGHAGTRGADRPNGRSGRGRGGGVAQGDAS